jgi:hypothetical protein
MRSPDPVSSFGLLVASVVAALALGRVALAGSPATPDPKIADLVSHVIDAYGGEKALRAVHGYHASGNQWASQPDVPIHAERWFARPDRLRLDLEYPDHHEIRITNGAQGWAGNAMESLAPANPMKLQAMRLQTARLDLPLRLLEHEAEIESRGTDPEGRVVLRIPIDSDLHIDYHIDTKTYHVTHITTGMPAMEFAADYDQFNVVDGVLIPYREVTFAGGTMTSKFQMTGVEWNPKDLESHLQVKAGE